MYVNSYHDDWDVLFDIVTFTYNTSRQGSTGVSPFFLLYGREAVLLIDVALGNNPDVSFSSDSSDRVRHLTSRLSAIREVVKQRLLVIQEKQKKML